MNMGKEVELDQNYGKQRIQSLIQVGNGVKNSVFWVGCISILSAWAIVVLQNAWLGMQVKKRL